MSEPMAGSLPSFLSGIPPRVLLFGGKGGVGKTTCATASALRLAQQHPGRRFVLVSTDPAHSTRDCLLGASLPPNLEPVEFDAAAYHQTFMQEHRASLHAIASVGTFLDDQDIGPLLDLSVPGLDELMAFLQLSDWTRAGRADTLVVDTAPTGHTLRLLSMPEFLGRWVEALDALIAKHRYMAGIFGARTARDSLEDFIQGFGTRFQEMRDLLCDPKSSQFVPVTIAEPPAIAETESLLASLDSLGVCAREVIVNQLVPERERDGALGELGRRQRRALRDLPRRLASRALWALPLEPMETAGSRALADLMLHLSPCRRDEGEAPGLDIAPSARAAALGSAALAAPGTGALDAPASLRLRIFAGKGGVGKTTMACAHACALAGAGVPTVLVSADPAHSLADVLLVPVGPVRGPVAPGLDAMALDAEGEFARLRELYAQELSGALSSMLGGLDASYDQEAMARLLDLAPPGLDEVMALLRVLDLLEEDQGGAIVLDTAPTGHLLRLLELPQLIEQWLKAIFALFLKYDRVLRLPRLKADLIRISKGVKRLRALLTDPASAAVFPVGIPTGMSLAETGDLVEACRRLRLFTPGVVMNMVTPEGPGELTCALRAREAVVLRDAERSLAPLRVTRVFRGSDPRGIAALTALGEAVFAPRRAACAA